MSRATNKDGGSDRINIRRDRLRTIRNTIDFRQVFRRLGWPWKHREDGVILFVCPKCSERQTSVNSKTNLARCFRCEENWNPIDFTMEVGRMDFLEAYGFLKKCFRSQVIQEIQTIQTISPFKRSRKRTISNRKG